MDWPEGLRIDTAESPRFPHCLCYMRDGTANASSLGHQQAEIKNTPGKDCSPCPETQEKGGLTTGHIFSSTHCSPLVEKHHHSHDFSSKTQGADFLPPTSHFLPCPAHIWGETEQEIALPSSYLAKAGYFQSFIPVCSQWGPSAEETKLVKLVEGRATSHQCFTPSPVSAGFRVNQPPPPSGVNETEQGAASWGWYILHDLQLLVSVRTSGELDFHLYLTSTFLFILRQQRSKSFPSAYLCLITSGLSRDLLLRHTPSPHRQETTRSTSEFPTFCKKERSWISKPPSATRWPESVSLAYTPTQLSCCTSKCYHLLKIEDWKESSLIM